MNVELNKKELGRENRDTISSVFFFKEYKKKKKKKKNLI